MAPQQQHLPSTSAEYNMERRRKAMLMDGHESENGIFRSTIVANMDGQQYASKQLSPPIAAPLPHFLPTNLIALFIIATIVASTMGQNTGKCYSFAPGLTIPGAEYRRDFGLSRRQCADVCKTDVCCMAFEWRRSGGQCTLKSRSLNGTVVMVPAAVVEEDEEMDEIQKREAKGGKANTDLFFALCLDYGDSERDRFWDHELGGPVVASASDIGREKCAQLCTEPSTDNDGDVKKRGPIAAMENKTKGLFINNNGIQQHRRGKRPRSNLAPAAPSVIYSWRTLDPTDVEAPLGECQCISVLQYIRLSFGSFAGFLI